MTEREIPDGMGFPFGGMTDASIPQSAPPVLSEPENPAAPVYSSRREARAAGGFSAMPPMDAAAPAPAVQPESPAEPAYDGIASLFPLLGDVTSPPLTPQGAAPSAFEAILAPPPADLGATQAIPAAEVATELATPVARYVVPQTAPVPVVRSWHTPDASVAAVFPISAAEPSAPAADPFV